jgi:hypothetical protein
MTPFPAKLLSALLVTASLAVPAPASAGTVYRWVDADGVTHFSQLPPPPGTEAVKSLDLKVPKPAAQAPGAAADAARLELEAERARRRELEKRLKAEEEARRRAEAERGPDVIYVNPPEDQGYVLLTPRRHHRRPWRRHRVPQPVPPGARTQAPDLFRVPDDFYESPYPRRPGTHPRRRADQTTPPSGSRDKTR